MYDHRFLCPIEFRCPPCRCPRRHRLTGRADGDDAPDFGFIYASPLIDGLGTPLPLIDYQSEVHEVFGSLRRTQLGLRAVSEAATARNLRRLLTAGVAVLHSDRGDAYAIAGPAAATARPIVRSTVYKL